MALMLSAVFIFAVWLVLSQLRKRQALKDIIDLQAKAIEKGADPPDLDRLLAAAGSRESSLRMALVSACLGATLLGTLFVVVEPERDVANIFRVVGILLVAFGVANFLVWLLIDRRR